MYVRKLHCHGVNVAYEAHNNIDNACIFGPIDVYNCEILNS